MAAQRQQLASPNIKTRALWRFMVMSSSFFYCIECVKRTCAGKSELSVMLVGGGG